MDSEPIFVDPEFSEEVEILYELAFEAHLNSTNVGGFESVLKRNLVNEQTSMKPVGCNHFAKFKHTRVFRNVALQNRS